MIQPYHPGDTATAIWVLRLYSIALSTGTLWFTYCSGRLIFRDAKVGLVGMFLVASIPGFIFIGSSINNDNLVTVAYAAGVYLLLRMWRRRAITRGDIAALTLTLAVAALSKHTGLSLYGVAYGFLALGALRGQFPWQRFALLVGVSLVGSGLLAGWWYLRNLVLYGDPLALRASLAIWGRGANSASTAELSGVWASFWMVLGYLNVRGPDWFYNYANLISVLGIVGAGMYWLRKRAEWAIALLSVGVFLLMLSTQWIITQQMNISQGRILYPALVTFGPVMAVGLRSFGGKFSLLLILPLAVVALLTPFKYLALGFSPISAAQTLAPDARTINARAETLTLIAYRLDTDTVAPGQAVRFTVYFWGPHRENPNIYIKAIDPITGQIVGTVDTYPGMAPTDALDPSTVYKAPLALQLQRGGLHAPARLRLLVGWRVPGGRYLPWVDNEGRPQQAIFLDGPTLIDPAQSAAPPETTVDVRYGDLIRLAGYTLSAKSLKPGGKLDVTLYWQYLKPIAEDWTVAIGLLNADNKVIAQADGMPAGYPTSAWREGPVFTDSRTLTVPTGTTPGQYRLYVGWYKADSGERLPLQSGGTLFEVPLTVSE